MSSLLKEYSGQIKLVYIDPPFDIGADFSHRVSIGDGSIEKMPSILEEHAYRDTWGHGQNSYLSMIYERLVLIHELLAEDGSLYVHLGTNVSHAVKLILDEVFGAENYRNEIVWKRATTVKGNFGQGTKAWGPATESILFYSKSDAYTFNQPFTDYTPEYIATAYRHVEEKTGRRYRLVSMIGPGGATKGNPQYEVMGVTRYWRYSKKTMDELIAAGLVVQPKPGAVPHRKYYLDEGKGVPVQSLWDDIGNLQASDSERIGYPTQKPKSLLERIYLASSNPDDLVADFFVGSGTTAAVAEQLARRWIACDLGRFAIHSTRKRLLAHPTAARLISRTWARTSVSAGRSSRATARCARTSTRFWLSTMPSLSRDLSTSTAARPSEWSMSARLMLRSQSTRPRTSLMRWPTTGSRHATFSVGSGRWVSTTRSPSGHEGAASTCVRARSRAR